MAKASGLSGVAKGRSDIYRIDPKIIKVIDGFNVRNMSSADTEAHVSELAQSIAEVGVRQPLTVRYVDQTVFLVDGHCRLAAVLRAMEINPEITTVPVVSENRYATDADLVASMLITNSGKSLSPLETAEAYFRLLGFGWTEEKIASSVGKSIVRVKQILEARLLPEPVKAMVATGKVSTTLAQKTFRETGEDSTETVTRLTDAVTVAQEAGKTKATEKHIVAADAARRARTAPEGEAPEGAPAAPKRAGMRQQRDKLLELVERMIRHSGDPLVVAAVKLELANLRELYKLPVDDTVIDTDDAAGAPGNDSQSRLDLDPDAEPEGDDAPETETATAAE